MSCAATDENFRPTICTIPGPTISIGTANSNLEALRVKRILVLVGLIGFAFGSASAAELAYLWDIITKPAYKHSLDAIVAGQPIDPWVKGLLDGEDGVSGPGKSVSIGQKPFEL